MSHLTVTITPATSTFTVKVTTIVATLTPSTSTATVTAPPAGP